MILITVMMRGMLMMLVVIKTETIKMMMIRMMIISHNIMMPIPTIYSNNINKNTLLKSTRPQE